MRLYSALLLMLLTTVVCVSHAQSDGCRAALGALSRVKEQINPVLSPSVDTGRSRLEVMLNALERGTHLCKDDYPELWYYRKVVGLRLATPDALKSAAYAERQLEERDYHVDFDPFTPPPSAQPSLPQDVHKVHDKWALVIGINEFEDPSIPALHFAAKDSTDFTNFLTDPREGRFDPSHVMHLVNGEATLGNIREGLGKLRTNVQPNDLVIVYISSHGSPRDMDPNGLSYIITADTHPRPSEKLYATSLQMIDLVQLLNREIKARRVVLILDTCYSGDAQAESKGISRVWESAPPPTAQSTASFSEALNNFSFGYGRAVITASRANEVSWESPQLHNGYFTYYLLEALKSNPNAPLDQVFQSVRESVSSHVQSEKQASQTPTSQFSEQASSIILSVPPSP